MPAHFALGAAGSAIVTRAAVAPEQQAAPPRATSSLDPGQTLTLDLAGFLAKFVGWHLQAVQVDDVENVIVTLKAANGQVFTKVLSRSAIASGKSTVTFTGLPLGVATLHMVASDVDGATLAEADQVWEVQAGLNKPAEVDLPLGNEPAGGSTGGGGSGGGAPLPVPSQPTSLDVVVQPLDGVVTATVPVSVAAASLTPPATAEAPIAGVNVTMAFGATGDSWLLRTTAEFSAKTNDTSHLLPLGDVLASSQSQLLHLDAGQHLLHGLAAAGARAMALDDDGSLWTADWPHTLRHRAADGTELTATALEAEVAYRGLVRSGGLVWVAVGTTLVRCDAAGAIVGATALPGAAGALAADGAGGVWSVAGNRLVHVGGSGGLVTTSVPFTAIAENPYARLAIAGDGALWATSPSEGLLVKLRADGSLVGRYTLPPNTELHDLRPVEPVDLVPDDATGLWLSVETARNNIGAQWLRGVLHVTSAGVAVAAYHLSDLGAALAFAPDGALWAAGSDLTRVEP